MIKNEKMTSYSSSKNGVSRAKDAIDSIITELKNRRIKEYKHALIQIKSSEKEEITIDEIGTIHKQLSEVTNKQLNIAMEAANISKENNDLEVSVHFSESPIVLNPNGQFTEIN